MIKVYHVKFPNFLDDTDRVPMSELHHVADVETDELEMAYRLTNTIDMEWWLNGGVKFYTSPQHGSDGCRSTSVGDVLFRNGEYFVVSSFGFRPIKIS